MTYVITPYAVTCAVAAIFALVVCFLAWNKRNKPCGQTLFLMMCSVFIWCGGCAFEYASAGIPAKVFWSKIEYIGTLNTPVLIFIFAVQYNRLNGLLTRRNVTLLFVIPAITFLLALTNEHHGLIWNSFVPGTLEDNLIIYGHGPVFWIGVIAYSYLMMILGTGLMIWSLFRYPLAYRSQMFLIVMGISAPWLGSLLYITGMSPVPGLELTPIFLVLTGGVFTWNLFYYQFLDLVPLARDMVIETLPDGMFVLDSRDRVIDFNPAVPVLLGKTSNIVCGMSILDIFPDQETREAFNRRLIKNQDTKFDFTFNSMHAEYLELSVSPVSITRRNFSGRLVILRDISHYKLAERHILYTNELLRKQVDEIEALQESLREKAIRDSLTGLYNRRYLDETLVRECAHAEREGLPLCICMLDIDHFKKFNDQYGHMTGDVMLAHLANMLQSNTRLGDIVCRYGGEEFAIVFPEISIETAYHRVEHMRILFEESIVVHDEQQCHGTFSAGIASYPYHGKEGVEVLAAADRALYDAKANGRNRVVLAELKSAA